MEVNVLIAVAVIWGVAVITPGPNFFITVHTAIGLKCRQSLYTVLGIVIGTSVWSMSGFLGISVLYKTAPFFYYALKVFGGLYLIYVGLNLILTKKVEHKTENKRHRSVMGCFSLGLLTNLLNPKTAIFMTSLFAATIPASATLSDGFLCVFIICSISAIWYSLVASFFSHELVKKVYEKQKDIIEKLAGAIFMGFGIKLLLTKELLPNSLHTYFFEARRSVIS